ncbi:histidine phosphatase family protein [Chitinibacter sp. ZOR0017]|uniref:histidine phosphatase family protein n=1 Tax=Chitinibacter sp. ZOR0017 TaxID=1339254 RepID=UPI0006472223|nr:histidine phosphatase family protein [Chitinibacter sp. ZOR0017]
MTRTIYLLRHGQTELNAQRRMQGHCDSPLTSLGQAQARAMGRTLRTLITEPASWQLAVSPLGRAQHTAQLVCAELGLPAAHPHTDARLIEVGFGDWEMQAVEPLHAQNPELAQRPDWHFAAPNVEPMAAVQARIAALLADPALPAQLIIVAHGLLGRFIRGAYAQLPLDEMLQQEMPQDAFYRLQHGQIERIACLDL